MRWSLPTIVAASAAALQAGQAVAAPQISAPGAPTDNGIQVGVLDQTYSPNIPHPGAPTEDVTSIDAIAAATGTVTYNDGMYTPWTDTADTQTESETAVTEDSATQYTEATSSDSPTSTPSTSPTTSSLPSTSPSTTSSPSSTSSVITSSTSSSPTSSSSSTTSDSLTTSSSSSDTLASSEATKPPSSSSSAPKMNVILPVALSIGGLALVCLGILLVVWRRRVNKQRKLNERRYDDDDFAEKGPAPYGADDGYDPESNNMAAWTSFQRHSGSDQAQHDVSAGMAGRGVGHAVYQGLEDQDNDNHRGWQWGSAGAAAAPAAFAASNAYRQNRGPLPMTPQQDFSSTLPYASSQPEDLNAMMAESRTGYEPYVAQPQRQKSVSGMASALYSSLSGRGKKYGTKASSFYSQDSRNGRGRYDEYGVWRGDGEGYSADNDRQPLPQNAKQSGIDNRVGAQRPLLAADIDGTPIKQGYRTYVPPESPSKGGRVPLGYPTIRVEDEDEKTGYASNEAVSGGKAVRRYTLRDGPAPILSPTTSKRYRAKLVAKTIEANNDVYDSPSVYSPSTFTHNEMHSPTPDFPDSLQPGRPRGPNGRTPSPAISQHPYMTHLQTSGNNVEPQSAASNNPVAQSSKSGTTYSLGGVAGMMYSGDAFQPQPRSSSVNGAGVSSQVEASTPPRQPVKKKALTKQQSTESAISSGGSTSPHRAISAVVKASKAGSGDRASNQVWDQPLRGRLQDSRGSDGSIDDLLTNVLGAARVAA